MNDKFMVTYDLEESPPHIQLDDYIASCNQQYSQLLSDNPPERKMQTFLEKHPCLVPGHSTPRGNSGHYPLHCSLITQPRLQGLGTHVPDFMWISTHSAAWFPTLIEIEKPDKKIFTKRGKPTSAFSEARHQLTEWRTWFKNPGNIQQFGDYYGIPELFRKRTMVLHMILIYGRRVEFESNPKLMRQIASLLPGGDEEIMSFDRLSAVRDMKDAITIRGTGYGKYEAVWVPPVFETGPDLANRLLSIDGVPEAIDQNEQISHARGAFLKRRIPYWKEWAASPGGHMIGPNSGE